MAFGFVLVGGRSERMGRDKSLLPYRGRPMALWQAEKLAFVCGRVALVGKEKGAYAGVAVPVRRGRRVAGRGRVRGRGAPSRGARRRRTSSSPRTSRASPEEFLSALLEVADAIPRRRSSRSRADSPQPLCAVWRMAPSSR